MNTKFVNFIVGAQVTESDRRVRKGGEAFVIDHGTQFQNLWRWACELSHQLYHTNI